MSKHYLFELVWLGYQADNKNNIAEGYAWDDLSDWSFAEMEEYLDKLINGLRLYHKYNDGTKTVHPALFE